MFNYGAGDGKFKGRGVGGGGDKRLKNFVLNKKFVIQKVSFNAWKYRIFGRERVLCCIETGIRGGGTKLQ